MAKTVISINNPYGFRINCKLSSSNKRIQCSINLKLLNLSITQLVYKFCIFIKRFIIFACILLLSK